MPRRSVGRYLSGFWIALFVAGLVGAETLVLQAPSKGQPDSQTRTEQSRNNEQPCRPIPDLAFTWVPIRTRLCVALFNNISFFDAYHDTINAFSTLLVAIFTFTLWRTTRGLLISDEKQMRIGRKSAKASLIAAKAAESQVNNAIRLEIPIVVAQKHNFKTDRILPNNDIYDIGTVWTSVENYGRTPAELISHCVEAKVLKTLPETPIFYGNFNFLPGTFLVRDQPIPLQSIMMLSEADKRDLKSGERNIWVFGYIRYRDFTEKSHEIRFCRMSLYRDDRPNNWFDFVVSATTPPGYLTRT